MVLIYGRDDNTLEVGSAMRPSELYAEIAELSQKGERFAMITIVGAHGSSPRGIGAKMLVLEDGTRIGTIGGDCLENDSVDAAIRMMAEDKANAEKKGGWEAPLKVLQMLLEEEEAGGVGMLCGGKVDVMVEIVRPELHLVVAGSGPVATSIVRLADFLDIPSTLVDPFPPRDKLPDSTKFVNEHHEAGIAKLPIGENSPIILVTRHKNDVPALRAALATKASYIGMIGSKHRVQTIFGRVAKELGADAASLAKRVYAPVGLDVGAYTPAEIALSILAEILTHYRKSTAQSKALSPLQKAVGP